jgi:hypothetical protein
MIHFYLKNKEFDKTNRAQHPRRIDKAYLVSTCKLIIDIKKPLHPRKRCSGFFVKRKTK